jgi:hypothetical protein
MGQLMLQNSVSITLLAGDILLNFLVLGDDMFSLHAWMAAYRFIVAHACFITCDNELQETLCFS